MFQPGIAFTELQIMSNLNNDLATIIIFKYLETWRVSMLGVGLGKF